MFALGRRAANLDGEGCARMRSTMGKPCIFVGVKDAFD
jgi:hypothetical protein